VVYQNCRGLVYGFPKGYGGFENPVAVALINYGDDNDLKLAKTHLPYGCELIGLVEFETDQDQSVYAVRAFIKLSRGVQWVYTKAC